MLETINNRLVGLGDVLLWVFRAARRSARRRASSKRRAAVAERRAAVADQRVAVKTDQVMVAAERKLERNDRLLQARMEKLVRTRLRDQMIQDRRAGLTVDPTKYMRTSTEISAEAKALIKETFEHLEQRGDQHDRRPGETMADWLARVKD